MSIDPPRIVFIYENSEKSRLGLMYQQEAAAAGFRVFAASWRDIEPLGEGMRIRQGHEVGSDRVMQPVANRQIKAHILVHRKLIWGQSEELMKRLESENLLISSYHPCWKPIGQKWIFESCFQTAEQSDLKIARPRTYLVPKANIWETLSSIGKCRPLIFKPSDASLCDGILLSSPSDFDTVCEEVCRSKWARYVVQDLVGETLLYNGRRFDLRIYALVTSFHPLHLEIPRDGVARLAAKPYDLRYPTDPLAVITGCTYRKRREVSTENLSIGDLLKYLAAGGMDMSDFWINVESLLRSVFTALASAAPLVNATDLEGRFYLAGVDVLMIPRGKSYSLLFLETNYVPDLVGWGSAVDAQLRPLHKRWLSHLKLLCEGGPAELT